MLLAVRLKWLRSVVIGQSRSQLVKLGRSVRFVCNVNVMDESFLWCR